MDCEIINVLNMRRVFPVLMNLAHLVRAFNFKFPFLQSSFICFSKVKLLSIVMPRNVPLELPFKTEPLTFWGICFKIIVAEPVE